MAAAEIIPNPDPSAVTSQAIDRAMEKAVEVFQADLTRVPTSVDRAILGLRELLETRITGIDHDMKGMHANLDKRETDIKEQITHLHDLVFSEISKLGDVSSEKFIRIETQFSERDTRVNQAKAAEDKRVDQLSLADKTAVAAGISIGVVYGTASPGSSARGSMEARRYGSPSCSSTTRKRRSPRRRML